MRSASCMTDTKYSPIPSNRPTEVNVTMPDQGRHDALCDRCRASPVQWHVDHAGPCCGARPAQRPASTGQARHSSPTSRTGLSPMAICDACNQEMTAAATTGCIAEPVTFPDGQKLAPVPSAGTQPGERCPDCRGRWRDAPSRLRPGGVPEVRRADHYMRVLGRRRLGTAAPRP